MLKTKITKVIKFVAIFLFAILINTGAVHAQTKQPPTGDKQHSVIPAVTALQYDALYASDGYSDLYLIDAGTGAITDIGPIGFTCTDLAFSGTTLYGVSFTDLISIDPTTGVGTDIGSMGYSDVNALTISPNGAIYAATSGGVFLLLNPATGAATTIGNFGSGMGSAGDLAYRYDDKMFASITMSGYSDSWLAEINMGNGTATPIGDMGYPNIYGLSYKDGILYGVSGGGEILQINDSTGASKEITASSVSFYGLTTSGKTLTGSITSPSDNINSAPASFQISATANYPGVGVKQVEFYVMYDHIWRSLGIALTPPYTIYWDVPSDLTTQQALLRIDVVGKDGYRLGYAGGVRHINIIDSLGNSNMVENWVPQRAYLNQRSLSPNGDRKCNVSSLSMVLAMGGIIGMDYQSMATQANTMYPVVAPNGNATTQTVWNELSSLSSDASKCDGSSTNVSSCSQDVAWNFLKASIISGNPVIIDSVVGMTSAGHFIVGIGYQEVSGQRNVIAYDPYGKWKGTLNQYYTNAPNDPLSHVGEWVNYDFSKLDGSDYYVFAAHSPIVSINTVNITPSSPPDITSDEPEISVLFDGLHTTYQIFLPFTMR